MDWRVSLRRERFITSSEKAQFPKYSASHCLEGQFVGVYTELKTKLLKLETLPQRQCNVIITSKRLLLWPLQYPDILNTMLW